MFQKVVDVIKDQKTNVLLTSREELWGNVPNVKESWDFKTALKAKKIVRMKAVLGILVNPWKDNEDKTRVAARIWWFSNTVHERDAWEESGWYLIFPSVIYGADRDFREFQAVGSVKHGYKPSQVVLRGLRSIWSSAAVNAVVREYLPAQNKGTGMTGGICESRTKLIMNRDVCCTCNKN